MSNYNLWALVPLSVALFLSCSKEAEQTVIQNEEETSVAYQQEPLSVANIYVDDEMAAMLENSRENGSIATKSAELNSVLDKFGVRSIERVFPDTGRFEERRRAFGLHRWYRIQYDPNVPETKAAEGFVGIDGIENFEPQPGIKLNDEMPFNDPLLPSQWHYRNDGSGNQWIAGSDINVFPVWASYTTGNSDVIVGVVDGGIDMAHEDLAGVVSSSGSWNFCNNSNKISAHNHGTHVAGTIGAINNNGLGVSGIAGGDAEAGVKGVTLLSLQIFSNNDGSGSGASGIVWAADHGAVICNNSWGFDFEKDDGTMDKEEAKKLHEFYSQPNSGEYKSAVKDAIDYFNTNAGLDENGNQVGPMAGGVVFFSAGNDGWQYGPPANYEGAISVGAYGPTGAKAYYSTYGTQDDNWIDIAAPGGDYQYSQIVSTLPGNAYGNMQGTSMACPHVSGVAALLVSYLGGPGFTRDMLLERMLNAPNPNLNLASSRIGIPIDAMGAISYGSDPEIPLDVTSLKAEASSNHVTLSWNVTASENGITAYAYRLFYGTDKDAVINATAAKPGTGVSTAVVETGRADEGDELSKTIDLGFETTYYFKVLGYDYNLNYSGNSNIASITTAANRAPEIVCSSDISSLVLKATQTLSLSFTVSEPDGHSFTITHTAGSAAESFLVNGSSATLKIEAPLVDAGTYTAVVTATDSYGKAASLNVKYTVRENRAPVAKGVIQNVLFSNLSETRQFSVSDYFEDPDGDDLTFDIKNGSPSVAHAIVAKGTVSLTSLDFGLADVTISASDAKKATASQSFKILVREPGIEMQAYPTTVTSTLHIGTGETLQSTSVKIFSQTGGEFYDGTVECSAFEPAEIDMKDAAPGKYTVIVIFGGKEYRQNIVKK
ncbi:MAG: S8 family serine peptidase [Bacteroidales bacterium]|nr:S8 family serine peptidase [Bacteroidales bacterium]